MLPKLDLETFHEERHRMWIEADFSAKKIVKHIPKRCDCDIASVLPTRLQSLTSTAGATCKIPIGSPKLGQVSVQDGSQGIYQNGGSFMKRKTEPRQLAAIDVDVPSKGLRRRETSALKKLPRNIKLHTIQGENKKMNAPINSPTGHSERSKKKSKADSADADLEDCHEGTSERKPRRAGFSSNLELKHLVHMRFIGQGGFGSVRLVEHKDTRCRYALKRIKTKGTISMQVSMECQLHAEIEHPFIAQLVKAFTTKGSVYVLTELVPGGSLYDHLGRRRLKKKEARFHIGALLLALEYLHQREIVYRDLKPENVVLDVNGYPKLIDFGLAKKMCSAKTYTIAGTMCYMAPDIFLGDGYDHSVDIWALGVMLYEFVCGHVPFGDECADADGAIECAILNQALSFPDEYNDAAGKRLLLAMLHKERGLRQTCIDGIKVDKYFKIRDGDLFSKLVSREIVPPFVPAGEQYPNEADFATISYSDDEELGNHD